MTRHNHNLPEDVLLEIFDAYRQFHELQPDYEKVWNSRDGWFKLAHVCVRWRRIVFSSSSRLHVRLLFTPRRSSKDPVLSGLPHFPILIDYRIESWRTEKEETIGLAAIEQHRSRVHGIAIRSPYRPGLLKSLSHPFPELESFKMGGHLLPINDSVTDLLVALLSGSASSLRRLTLQKVKLARLSPLLSSTTGLEKLALKLWATPGIHLEVFLIPNLQRMSCLRRLELKFLMYDRVIAASPNPPLPASARDVVPLPRLTDLIFVGHSSYLEILATRLAAPSLQRLEAEYYGEDATSPLPQLCKFICYSESHFKAILLYLGERIVKFGAETSSKSDHAEPAFRISIPAPTPWEQIGQIFAGPLSTVEELVIVGENQQDHINWRALFNYIPHVKIVQVHCNAALGVADAFQLDGQEPAQLDLLPFLERVEVEYPSSIHRFSRNISYERIRDAFEPLIATRQQVGRPIKLSRT